MSLEFSLPMPGKRCFASKESRLWDVTLRRKTRPRSLQGLDDLDSATLVDFFEYPNAKRKL